MLSSYYADPHIRARIIEFLGGASLEDATSVFVTSNGHLRRVWFDPQPVAELWNCVGSGLEIARSLWDRHSLIAHLDIEYVNFDHPAEAYLRPARSFAVQRPVVRAIQEVLLRYGIAPLHLLSGRGHHFVWRVDRSSEAMAALAKVGRVPETLAARYACPQLPYGEAVPQDFGAAFVGLGMALEHVAHQVLAAVDRDCEIPMELTAVEAGPSGRGREVVSIDLSEYGDPLFTRSIRIPFSAYLKPQQSYGTGADWVERLPPLFMIPLHEIDDQHGLLVMRDVGEVIALARLASVRIPEQAEGTANLVADYRGSPLARFHDHFYSAAHDTPEEWPRTYDRTPLEPLPPCARQILTEPNELLLKPAAIQLVVRVLMSLGWHPRHIAGLIRSKYERDYGWGEHWYYYDASSRADFYTRIFAALIATGRDDLVDFNCRSTQEKGYCSKPQCDGSLEESRLRLLNLRSGSGVMSASHENVAQRRGESP